MELSLHANAATTPKTRAYIQRSKRSVAELAAELGVSETTIRRWRGRSTVADRPHTPNVLQTSLTAIEERLVCELRISLQLPLDDIVEVLRRCVNASLSRSAIHRCLQRHGISARPKPDKPKPGIFETASIGFIHLDLKHSSAGPAAPQELRLCRDRSRHPLRLCRDPFQTGWRDRSGLPQALPDPLPARGSYDPDRQRRRVHRPLRRRHEEQAARPALRQPSF